MKIEIEIPSEKIADQMITAIESGIAYWCDGVFLKDESLTEVKPWYADPKLYENEALKITVHEEAEENPVEHEIGLDDFRKGLILLAENSWHFADIMTERSDATTADVFFQYIVFKEVIYG